MEDKELKDFISEVRRSPLRRGRLSPTISAYVDGQESVLMEIESMLLHPLKPVLTQEQFEQIKKEYPPKK